MSLKGKHIWAGLEGWVGWGDKSFQLGKSSISQQTYGRVFTITTVIKGTTSRRDGNEHVCIPGSSKFWKHKMAGMSHKPFPHQLPSLVPPPCPGRQIPLTFLSPHALQTPRAYSLPSFMLGFEYTLKSLQIDVVLQKAVPWHYEKQQNCWNQLNSNQSSAWFSASWWIKSLTSASRELHYHY